MGAGLWARRIMRLVAFQHTIFALPLAYAGALLGSSGLPSLSQIWWITVAMVAARTGAMALNRYIDRHIDALNPRTEQRLLPTGQLSPTAVMALAVLSLCVLALAASRLNTLCLLLFPLVVFLFVLYPYTKRFTCYCHYWLGAVQFCAPAGAWLAVSGRLEWGAVVFGLAAGLWVAGFDIIYGSLDLEFDREHGIHSLPSRLGLSRALAVSAWTHAAALFFFALLRAWVEKRAAYDIALMGVASLLLYQHVLVRPHTRDRAQLSFFPVNALIGLVVLAGVMGSSLAAGLGR